MAIASNRSVLARRALTALLVLGGWLLLDGQLGPISLSLRKVAVATLLAVMIGLTSRSSGRRPWMIGIASAATVLIAFTSTPILGLLSFTVAISVMGLGERAFVAQGIPETILTLVSVHAVIELIPPIRMVGQSVGSAALLYTHWANRIDHWSSPTALGGPAILGAVIFLVWRWRRDGSWMRLVGAGSILLGWFLLLPVVTPMASSGPTSAFVSGAVHGLAWLGVAILVDALAPAIAQRPITHWNRWLLGATSVVALLVGVTLVGVVIPSSRARRTILVHNRGGLDWDRPVFGKFGPFNSGMFGLLPVYLRANGYSFEVLDRDTVTMDDLGNTQILVLINSPKLWAGAELEAVRNFVANGGGLLVLGDHTDVFGLMRGFNTLLNGFDIQFRFDSAYHARAGWRGCLATSADTVTSGWEAGSPMVAIGASLDLRGFARPILTGRYGHSDDGVRSNLIGSYLGNYRLDQDEMLGDQVLMATTTFGRGRIVVLGDTTPFQGGQSNSFERTSGRLLAWLSRPNSLTERPPWRIAIALAWLAVLCAVWVIPPKNEVAMILGLTLLAGAGAGLIAGEQALSSPVKVGSDCVLLDDSHLPAIGHYDERINPSGPLENNLLRSGFRVAYLRQWDSAAIAQSRAIAFVAPQRRFTRAEVDDLLEYESRGGVVILATGQPDASAARPVLQAHRLALSDRPLGTVPNAQTKAPGSEGQAKETPRFLDAWPVVTELGGDPAVLPGAEVLYRDGDDVIALFQRRGRGGLLLIADSRFFATMNVEDTAGHRLGNLALIHDLFRRYLNAAPDQVQPLFRSPLKPE